MAERFPRVILGSFVVMPNHIHGVILLDASPADEPEEPSTKPLSSIVQWLKTGTTYDYIEGVKNRGRAPFDRHPWQRNYYEHITRNDKEHERIAAYIEANPSLWRDDALHPTAPEFTPRGR